MLGDLLERQTCPYIGRAVQQLTDLRHDEGDRYGAKALGALGLPRYRPGCAHRVHRDRAFPRRHSLSVYLQIQ